MHTIKVEIPALVPVESSNVQSASYEPKHRLLFVQFHKSQAPSGAYAYFNVPDWRHEELMKAPSVGSYLARNIKDNVEYPYSRLGKTMPETITIDVEEEPILDPNTI